MCIHILHVLPNMIPSLSCSNGGVLASQEGAARRVEQCLHPLLPSDDLTEELSLQQGSSQCIVPA